ncbi:MAG: hypothetical protein EON93_04395 [Burkholderiales bacterium]|nr:MAG: hypothetical protein EON93_04395 [Burkholderiales bacterium]
MRMLVLALLALAAPAVAQPGQKLAAGDWHGTGLQVNPGGIQSTWTIDMSINTQRSMINYPSLGCTGVLHRVSSTPTQIVFREQITEGDCIDNGRITVTLENGRIFWFWTKPGLDADASAVLYPSRPVA